MSLRAELKGPEVHVKVPITRSGILQINHTSPLLLPFFHSLLYIMHACDIMEDVAIAYGYNNIVKQVPQTVTMGAPQPLNKVTDLVRLEVANAGYTEILTFSLVSSISHSPTHPLFLPLSHSSSLSLLSHSSSLSPLTWI
jgi:hypothetical protein